MLAEFIDLILTLCFTLVPFAAAGFVAFVVCSIVFKIADKKEREERREAHRAQAASDMYEKDEEEAVAPDKEEGGDAVNVN